MNRTVATLAVLLAAFAFGSPAWAGEGPGPGPGPRPPGPHGPNPMDALMAPGPGIPAQVAAKLGVPEDKLKKIRDAAFAANDELITLEANARRAQLQLDRLLGEPVVDEKKALERLDELGAAELAVRKNRVRLLLRVRSLLGPELFQKLQHAAPPFDAGPDSAMLSVKLGAELAVAIPDIERVALGDPEVADLRVEAGRIRITGTSQGRTTLIVWVKGGRRHTYLVDVRP